MMNDFDFIRDQIDKSEVNAPAHMDESYVLEQLSDTQPKVVPIRPKRHIGRIAAIAAAFVAVAAIGTAVGVQLHSARVATPPVTKEIGLIRFTNYDQVKKVMQTIDERNSSYYRNYGDEDYAVYEADSAAAGSSTGSSSSSSGAKGSSITTTVPSYDGYDGGKGGAHSDTYKQVEAVDEADIIKTDGRYIYAVEQVYSYTDEKQIDAVAVFPAVPGTVDPIVKIIPGEGGASTPDEASRDKEDEGKLSTYSYYSSSHWINDIFLKDNRLVILYSDYIYYETESDGGYHSEDLTRAYVYDVADVDHVALLDTYTQSGGYVSSRMIGDTLYLITADSAAEDIPVCGRGSTPDQIPADCIYSVESPDENVFLIVSAYDTLDHTAVSDSKAILGAAQEVYCNEENLYITATDWHYTLYGAEIDYAVEEDGAVASAEDSDALIDLPEPEYEPVSTRIYKVSLTDGIAFTAYGEVEGYINSQYSLDEYNGCLRVAATTENEDYDQTNNLYVLDGDLKTIGSVTGFADDEHIEAVRFVGDTAYVITYRTTDPLFVIDLSEPTAPAILGEVKISGFSTMLVPLDENTILGLGFNTDDYATYDDIEVQDGFKLALFDVSDPAAPQVLDSRSYLHSYSEVMYNPKALIYNADRDDFVIPLNYYNWSYDEDTDDYTSEEYGGMLNFAVRDGKIAEVDRYRSIYNSIYRCVYVDDTVYMTYINDSGTVHLESVSYR